MLAHAPPAPQRLPPHPSRERRRPGCPPGPDAPCGHPQSHRSRGPTVTHAAGLTAAANAADPLAPLPPFPLPAPPSSFPALAHPDVAHFLNLTNGLEAAPLLRALGLPYTLVRLPSTLCEQQRFDALVGGADTALLAAAALGRTCVVWDFGSRGVAHRGGPPRAVWYGLEFLAYAAHRKWFSPSAPWPDGAGEGGGASGDGEGGTTAPPPRRAVLRGHDVTHVFEAALRGGRGWGTAGAESPAAAAEDARRHARWVVPGFDPAVSGVTKATVKRLRYFRRFVPEDADPATHIRLWGAHRPTTRDSDVEWHVRLAREECGPGGGGGATGAATTTPATIPPPAAAAAVVAADGRVCPVALAAELEALGFGLFTGGVPHAPYGVPPAADAARAKMGD